MKRFSPLWLDVIADLFINLSAGWFAVVFIEPQVYPIRTIQDLLLTLPPFGLKTTRVITSAASEKLVPLGGNLHYQQDCRVAHYRGAPRNDSHKEG